MDVTSVMRRAATFFANREAIVHGKDRLTFAAAWERGCRLANGLIALGLQPGERVAVLEDNSKEAADFFLGAGIANLVRVPLYPRNSREAHLDMVGHTGCKALVVGGNYAHEVADFKQQLPDLRHILVRDEGYEGWLANQSPEDPMLPIRPEDNYVIRHTGGTTGRSKGVALSFRAVVANTESVTTLWRFSPADTMALALPLFHVHGLGLGVHGALLHRMPILLFERFDAGRIAEAFARGGASVFQGVPTMYVKLLELLAESPEAARALARGRLFTSGSAALAAGDFARFEELTGHRILERYGMSETLFTLSNPYEDRRPGTVGLPIPGCEVRIVDEAGRDAAAGEPGEIFVKGNGMMSGYWRRPEETAASFRDGWFATGDMASRDRAGYVTIAGRKSVDFIKSGGFKISAREIEDVLRVHPRVKDVAVVGAPDRVWGERIVAAVVLQPAAGPPPSPKGLLEELSAFCARSLADYKRPREVRILEDLPRNALGKVQKHRILEGLS